MVNQNFYVGFIIGFIIMAGVTFFILNSYGDVSSDEFYKEYTIALNDYYVGYDYFMICNSNLEKGNYYILGEYYYEDAIDYFDLGKEQAKEAESFLIISIDRLESLKETTPNEFFDIEIDNRIEQSEILLELSRQYYKLLDYTKVQLYEVNYGSESRATEYNDKYNVLTKEVNKNLKELDVVNQRIDSHWDKDWYPSFQDTELY